MDLKQRKLSKSEWDSIEIPVSIAEQGVLKMIKNGYHNVNIRINNSHSIFTYLKIEYSPQIEDFIYSKFFASKIKDIVSKYSIDFIEFSKKKKNTNEKDIYYIEVADIVRLNSSDQLRMNKFDTSTDLSNIDIFDFILYQHLHNMIIHYKSSNKWLFHYYTLSKLVNYNVSYVNKYIIGIIKCFLTNWEPNTKGLLEIIKFSKDLIEKNKDLLKYSDSQLYEHQKTIFTIFKKDNEINQNKIYNKQPQKKHNPTLVLYIAPTGTGKTLTPLGLSEKNKIIFVCAARHVGLALARSAISLNKKIAFAFGCSSAEDVRLHYFAAKDYTTDWRSGSIRKVDNTVGDKVEIMICDIRSYLPAMYYMVAFNKAEDIITYWDEPTISLDYNGHELHEIIKKNWSENIIPNVVLSSATLPKEHEINMTINDFKERFSNTIVHNIVSHDCKKTIPIINNNGYIVMPHLLTDNYSSILDTVKHCEECLTILRYFDIDECSKFINYIENNELCSARARFSRNFLSVDDIDLKSIKTHYLRVLKNIIVDKWPAIYNHFMNVRFRHILFNNGVDNKGNKIHKTISASLESNNNLLEGKPLSRLVSEQITGSPLDSRINDVPGSSGVFVTTKDAYTLTDGPTIFIANDLQKIAKFCIQQSNIPSSVMKNIVSNIDFNNELNKKIYDIEQQLETEEKKLIGNASQNDKKKGNKKEDNKKINKLVDKTSDININNLREEREILRTMVKRTSIDDIFVPNKLPHLQKWADNLNTKNSFTSNIDEEIVSSIMLLDNVDDSWKVLLLLGIGVFTEHKSSEYTEIMKKLADTQKLYLIIADSDYIYGTNYQFCHGYISKDLILTQEKIIQALGRIGRNNIQQEYSARFRDDEQINILFKRFNPEDKPEVINMNCLFNSKNIVWNGSSYEEKQEQEQESV
jgi:hypothetical protein